MSYDIFCLSINNTPSKGGLLIHNTLQLGDKATPLDVQSAMPWFPTKGSIRRHMISHSEGSQRSSQLAKYNPMYSFPSNSAAPAASVRVSVSA